MTKIITIKGMSCMHCAAHVEKTLCALGGVKAKVDLKSGRAEVAMLSPVSDETLKEAVENEGYTVVSIA